MPVRAAESSAYDCAICLSRPAGHVHQCTNGHIFCAECLDEHRASETSASSRCPTCRVTLPAEPIRNLLVESAIADGLLPEASEACSSIDCTWKGPASLRQAHEQTCVHAVCEKKLAIHAARTEHVLKQEMLRLQKQFDLKWRETKRAELERRVFAAYREASLPASSLFRVELVKPDADLTTEGFSRLGRVSADVKPCHNRILCMIPGVEGTAWAGGCFPLLIRFDHPDPLKPPQCCFPACEGPRKERARPLSRAVLRACSGFWQSRELDGANRPNGFMHTNVYPSGKVDLITLIEDKGWDPSFSITEILLTVQLLLDDPNADDPAQLEPYVLYRYARAEYDRRVREQASSFSEEHFNQLARQYCRPAPYGVRYTECGQHRIVRGVRG